MGVHDHAAGAIRVFLVDDHDIVRRGLRDLLAVKHDITVVGDSGRSEDAVNRILALRPDVMVLDLQLQDGSGIHVCRAVRAVEPGIHGLLVTSAAEDEALVATLLAGASGYATKVVNSAVILDDLRRVGAGQDLVDPKAAERVKGMLLGNGSAVSDVLSESDASVLAHMLDQRTDSEIAAVTGLSADDVAQAVQRVVSAATKPMSA